MISSPQTLTPALRSAFLVLVERYFGIRDSNYAAARLDQAVNLVLPTTTCDSPAELLETLRGGTNAGGARWLSDIVGHLTVGETYFWRDLPQISALRDTVLPDIAERRAADRRLRIWSAGCSTGEEAVTLAILVLEKELGSAWDVLLVGTDVNRESLRVAREGQYPARSFRATPDHLRARYFEADEGGWRPIEPIRRMTAFAWTNLGADVLAPPAAEIDLIVCRNVTIYFDAAATQRLYLALIHALAPGGWLLLGPSDALPTDRTHIERVEADNAVLWRRVAPAKRAIVNTTARKPHTTALPMAISLATPEVDAGAELEAGLLALEAGSAVAAVELLRRATFRDPHSTLGQFALARAYLEAGDVDHARAALLQTRRLLSAFAADAFVPGSDSLPAETLRQTIQTRLAGLQGR